jgi:glutathione S-transferase
MRARLAILMSQQTVFIRAIVLKNKPDELLALSPKGTVPVLVLGTEPSTQVIDESLDIMLWALNLRDPDNLLYAEDTKALPEMLTIINENAHQFKPHVERYKRAKRLHADDEEEECRLQCEPFIQGLEQRLSQQPFLMGSTPSLLDFALLPFVRQYSRVNKRHFQQGAYSHLNNWLKNHLQSQLFSKAMLKYPLWLETYEENILGKPASLDTSGTSKRS